MPFLLQVIYHLSWHCSNYLHFYWPLHSLKPFNMHQSSDFLEKLLKSVLTFFFKKRNSNSERENNLAKVTQLVRARFTLHNSKGPKAFAHSTAKVIVKMTCIKNIWFWSLKWGVNMESFDGREVLRIVKLLTTVKGNLQRHWGYLAGSLVASRPSDCLNYPHHWPIIVSISFY